MRFDVVAAATALVVSLAFACSPDRVEGADLARLPRALPASGEDQRGPAPLHAITASAGASRLAASRTPAGPPVAFNREAYQYSTSWTTSQEANRYQVLVLTGNESSLIPQLKAIHPGIKILLYQAIMATNSHDYSWMKTVTGCTAYSDDVANHPAWILHDQNGALIAVAPHTDTLYMTDVGSAAYQRQCATNAVALAKHYGFDGVFWDMVNGRLDWLLNPGVRVPEYPTAGSWAAAMSSALAYLGPALRAQGLISVGNIGAAPDVPTWETWAGDLDGAEEESWTDGSLGTLQQVPFFADKLAELAWTQSHGEYELVHSWNGTAAGNTYGLAAMLLAASGTASYSTSNTNYTSEENWFPAYGTARSLGAALGPYTVLANGAYERAFEKGLVVVNASASAIPTFSLGGTYSGSGYKNVTAVSLPATSGLILLGSPSSPTP